MMSAAQVASCTASFFALATSAAVAIRRPGFTLFLEVLGLNPWHLHKATPKSLRFLSAVMTEQGLFSDCFPYFGGGDLSFSPFENQDPLGFQNSHTFSKTVMKHFWPIFIETSILLSQPRIISHSTKMRRIPYNERKGIIFKRKIREIALNIGVDNTTSFGLTFPGFPDPVHFLSALVGINRRRVGFIEPD